MPDALDFTEKQLVLLVEPAPERAALEELHDQERLVLVRRTEIEYADAGGVL